MGEFGAPWRRSAGVGTVSALALALAATPASAQGDIVGANAADAVAGRYIVVLEDARKADAVAGRVGARVAHRYRAAVQGFSAAMPESAARRLAVDPDVAYVAQDRVVRLEGTSSWGLDRIDQRDLPLDQTYSYGKSGQAAHVYVVDTGIRTSHSDFGGRASFDFNAIDTDDSDCNGHGTHVAGTIGGGSYGVAKAARLHAVKVLGCGGSGTVSAVVAGVDWVTANHVRPAVANMSLSSGVNDLIDTAVRRSIDSGVTYVAAAGNGNQDACLRSPARVEGAITVAASDGRDVRGSFSNFGTCADLYAPGVGIASAWYTDDTASAYMDGTSMAAPHVAGAAALHLAARPADGPQQVQYALAYGATRGRIADAGPGTPNLLLYLGPPTPAQPGADRLLSGESLSAGQSKASTDGAFRLKMQTDGNLVLYTAYGEPLWHTNTWGSDVTRAVLQPDGNLVLYSDAGVARWHTSTYGTAADRLIVQTDGNVVLYGPDGRVFWHRRQ
ncbi:subtilisin family serine protease [Saccharothrix tamanrassetensis]|uniref:Subtilisin family serine protease n=1 Tax=Saccharothrix tamanrassetensis TaxID=1051531 RepID=A0A841CGA8_9PSEU|nr:S8 family serine peptidase [Saccharothrix tamanrassetensis]MBB5956030.1 subtilisin family serine protease [Saccharothrix tamanrassetensis]